MQRPINGTDSQVDPLMAVVKAGEKAMSKAWKFAKLGSLVGATELVIKVIAFSCGILVIRILSPEQYALYTLANAMLGTMTFLSDGGITSGVMAEGGLFWRNRQRLGAVIASGLALRKRFAMVSLVVSVPILFYFLTHHGATPLMAGVLILSIIPAFIAGLSGKILEIIPKLHQEVGAFQKVQVISNLGRLILTALFLFFFPIAAIAIVAAGAPQIWVNWRLRILSATHIEQPREEDPEIRRNILSVVKRVMPGAVFQSLKGQIGIFLVGIMGTTQAVGQLGALGRLVMILSIFNVVFATIIIPRFARLQPNKSSLIKNFLAMQSILWVMALLIVVVVGFFPSEILWILGSDYSGLKAEVILLASMTGLSLIAGGIYSLNASRGYILNPIVFLPLDVLILAGSYWIFPPVDTYNALAAGTLAIAFGPPVHLLNFWLHWRKIGEADQHKA